MRLALNDADLVVMCRWVVAEQPHHERFQLRVAGAVSSDQPKPVMFLISGGCIRPW
jgi:hypothetical protein